MVDARSLTEIFFEDADRIVEGVRREAPRILAEHLGRVNEQFKID